MYLTDWFEDTIEYKGTSYHLDLDYHVVLTVLELVEDVDLSESQRVYTALEMLLNVDVLDVDYYEAVELLAMVMDGYISEQKEVEPELDIMGNPMKTHKPKASYDFVHDGRYIDASFMQAYGINLFEKRGELHWRRFLALFEGLPNDTTMMQVINIRQMPIPEGDPERAQSIAKLKHIYKLPERGE